MDKEKVPNNLNLESSSSKKSSNTNSPKLMSNSSENIEQSYLPKMRTDYTPSNESVESATGVDFSINMPNPAADPIVSNNISNAEFDYTEE
ncbi:hypothetical protein psyc5s11_51150 [Clostridium gelidum]|uniref:Uncharacterized protein n=1 Tax=Clostridium gelidum TaxID=704125 RepID=A0ABM7TLJ1_9CLOT|nr:hypothetical protein [Clostridium gelidum]BCZ49048.1 hypothetical protein psyc5s11_51150 [Clostridium gelidum]